MKTTKFLTLLGNKIEIEAKLLDRQEVENAAGEFFGCKVVCRPGAFGHNTVTIGWRCDDKHSGKMLGFMSIVTGVFCHVDDYDYPINVFIPIGKSAAYIHGNEICYTGRILAIYQPYQKGLS